MASATSSFQFRLNGEVREVAGRRAHGPLLDYVRSISFTGAKEGCAEGECGACAVLLVQDAPAGTTFRAVNSCLVPLASVAGQEVYTVEALKEEGRLAEAQEAMARLGGSQCGYCTPGFVVSLFAAHHRPGRDANAVPDVHELGGNLCRCTGYRPIRDALLTLGSPREGRLKARRAESAPVLAPVKYQSGVDSFARPCNLAECLELAAEGGARFVAGNTDLGVLANLRDERCAKLISLEGVGELREFSDGPDTVEIGAGLTLTEIGERWMNAPPVIGEWLHLFASPLIRNRATLGGNLGTASPIGDSAPLLLALDAEVRIASLSGERVVRLAEFFHGYRRTSLAPGEILRSVRIRKPIATTARFYKVAKRRLDDISSVAMGIAAGGDGLTLGLGGMAAVPVQIRARSFEEAEELANKLTPISDHRASAAYRLAMAGSLLRKYRAEVGI